MNELTAQLHRLHTPPLGAERVRRNLQIEAEDVAAWCRARILDPDTVVERVGKNWYATAGRHRITVNAHSYTIITAHKIKG